MMSHRNLCGSFWTYGKLSVKRLCLRCGGLKKRKEEKPNNLKPVTGIDGVLIG